MSQHDDFILWLTSPSQADSNDGSGDIGRNVDDEEDNDLVDDDGNGRVEWEEDSENEGEFNYGAKGMLSLYYGLVKNEATTKKINSVLISLLLSLLDVQDRWFIKMVKRTITIGLDLCLSQDSIITLVMRDACNKPDLDQAQLSTFVKNYYNKKKKNWANPWLEG